MSTDDQIRGSAGRLSTVDYLAQVEELLRLCDAATDVRKQAQLLREATNIMISKQSK
ncbi:hypothetical protein GJW-30_1_04433 [Variibacter gotjawalensis]|uniref:Uncharacterized protein n=1 Tax=Variibacter gotjawalensis TaxID=1333996 RepID=A0A0S3Q123_9BRAD|nr:hypothetical protein [Variibacter gotjawalensis]RZS49608.1 hypothetical protein EV661_2044 [Variibacter gotjawalensis]BAT61871.1 hypothetical protein GJW-30_1_04433 [Variibacter gotjawalensis]